jgi:hypothetical protein
MSTPSAVTVPASGSELAEAIKQVMQDALDNYAPDLPPPAVQEVIDSLDTALTTHGYHYASDERHTLLPWRYR